MSKPKQQKYRVFINQVNRQMIEVDAASEDEAREKGYRKWRQDYAHSDVDSVEQEDPDDE